MRLPWSRGDGGEKLPDRPRTRLDWVMYAGLGLAGCGFLWAVAPYQETDTAYFPVLRQSTYGRRAPRVLIDEAHWNLHTMRGRYQGFADLLTRDGYRVARNQQELIPELMAGHQVLVIANALGLRGLVQHTANLVGLDGGLDLKADALNAKEVEAVREWVKGGGGLLLVADHAPCGEAARSMAAAFGIGMTDWYVEDPGSVIWFQEGATGERASLGDHPILKGRPERDEDVRRVATFSGQSLVAPPASHVLLAFSADALEYPRPGARKDEARSAAGKAQAVALEYGKGRVVVVGEAAALTAQRGRWGGQEVRYGINSGDTDNKQFVLNILHWLSRAY